MMNRISVNTLVTTTLVAISSIAAHHAQAADQLLMNPSFEQPVWQEGDRDATPNIWFTFASENGMHMRISRNVAREGKQSLLFSSSGKTNAFQGACQVVSVEPHRDYEFVVHVYVDPDDALRAPVHGQLSIEWLNEGDEEISRAWGPEWTYDLTPGAWHAFTMMAPVPDGAVGGNFVITHFDPGDPHGGGTFYVDDVRVQKLP